jgi:hypothetical protein
MIAGRIDRDGRLHEQTPFVLNGGTSPHTSGLGRLDRR